MKHLAIIMLVISLSSTDDITKPGKEKKKDPHETQKKQFVNFINDDGEYARNFVDLTSNEADGFDDIFRGRGNNGGSMMDGSMQLTENSLGGLDLDADSMAGAYNHLGLNTNAFASFEDGGDQRTVVHVYPAPPRRRHLRRRLFICKGNSDVPWRKLRLKCASSPMGQAGSPDAYNNDGFGNSYPSFFGTLDVNTPGQDILSPFYNSENKLEDNINLSDNIGGSNQLYPNQFNDALQSLAHGGSYLPSKSKPSSDSDTFNSEMGEIESSDAKLQKLLEQTLGSSNDNNNGDDAPTTVGGFLSALLSQQANANGVHSQHIGQSQSTGEEENMAGGYDQNQQQMQQNALNQLSGTMGQNEMAMQPPVTVHVHASDKPNGHRVAPPPEESRAVAQQAQDAAMKQHKAKLARLKKRLALLRQKLTELEDEQSKKSTKNNDPKETRKDAIKKILIKNLKLAAMIASREVQLEESKTQQLEFMSRRKEDDSITDGSNKEVDQVSRLSSSKPLTELSKKAEEEVNHLTKTDRPRLNTTLGRKLVVTRHKDTSKDTPRDTKEGIAKNTFNKIKETLQKLDSNSNNNIKRNNKNAPRSHESAKVGVFLKKLQTQIRSMSSSEQASMGKEHGKRSLRNELKRFSISERNLKRTDGRLQSKDKISKH